MLINLSQIIGLFIAALTTFIFLRIGTKNFQKGWFKRGIKFGDGTADIRFLVVAVIGIVIVIMKVTGLHR